MEEYPITRASLNLTRSCNLNCAFCFTYGCTKGDMSWDIAKKSVDFLFNNAKTLNGSHRLVDISFWGGEPLLKWSLLQNIVSYAKERSAQDAVSVNFGGTTNGTLLTPDKFDYLDRAKCKFLVSFDGTPETHNTYRKFHNGEGSHSVVEKNFKEALERWPDYRPRQSLIAERAEYFFEDMKYLMDLGCNYIIFSPVYESPWTDEKWAIWKDQAKKVVDYIKELRDRGRKVELQHFSSYIKRDDSKWPCGAGRNYVGIDIDGAIYPCHRFNKFNDNRSYAEKETCIGHVDTGVTNIEFRNKFINFKPQCGECKEKDDTPCHGGCYAVNFDFTKSIDIPCKELCNYVGAQKEVSAYLKEKIGMEQVALLEGCICHNMCYAEGTEEEIKKADSDSTLSCLCYNSAYTGPMDPSLGRPLTEQEKETLSPSRFTKADRSAINKIFSDISRRLKRVEEELKIKNE